MVIKKIIYYFFTFLTFVSLQAMLTEEQLEIVKKYPVSKEIASKLDEHETEIATLNKPKEYSWLSGFFVKPELDRILGAEILNNAIHAKKSKKVFVPNKYFYKDRVIAEKVIDCGNENLTMEQVKELCDLFTSVIYIDGYILNLMKTRDGRVGIVDTELRHFGDKNNKDQVLQSLHVLRCNVFENEETHKYLLKQITLKEEELQK